LWLRCTYSIRTGIEWQVKCNRVSKGGDFLEEEDVRTRTGDGDRR